MSFSMINRNPYFVPFNCLQNKCYSCTSPLNLTRRHCHLVLSIVNVLSVFISWFCAWSFAVLKTILCILQSQWLATTFTLIYLTYLFDERRLELRWCRWSPFLLGDQERDLECGVHDFKFCQKIAGFNKKENRKSKLTSNYLLKVRSSFLLFLFLIE